MEKISRELGLFQNDVRSLSIPEIKKIQAAAWIVMQLKRFSREELKLFYQFCDAAVEEKRGKKSLNLNEIKINDGPPGPDCSIEDLASNLYNIFKSD